MPDSSHGSFTEWINAVQDGREFYVKFRKRTTGELRTMRCKVDTRHRSKPGELPYDPAVKLLLPVMDLDKNEPRMLPCGPGEVIAVHTGDHAFWFEDLEDDRA